MTITWPTSGTTICHGASRAIGDACGPDNLSIARVPGLISREPVEGGGPRREATGNDDVRVQFGVYIRCANGAAAEAMIGTIAATAAVGELAMGGSLTLKDAGLIDLQLLQKGTSIRAVYTFGGHL